MDAAPQTWLASRTSNHVGGRRADRAYGPSTVSADRMGAAVIERVLVCGGRDFDDERAVFGALDVLVVPGRDTVIQGGAPGADRLARYWCQLNRCRYENYPADWKAHGRGAGPIRNQQMIDEGKPTKVICFPGGRGTADMERRAVAAGIPIHRYLASGD